MYFVSVWYSEERDILSQSGNVHLLSRLRRDIRRPYTLGVPGNGNSLFDYHIIIAKYDNYSVNCLTQ